MKITQTQKVIIAIIMFSASGYVIYSNFFASKNTPVVANPLTQDSSTSTSFPIASVTDESAFSGGVGVTVGTTTSDITAGSDIIDLATKLSNISIDSALFNSPLFKNLKDFDIPLSPEIQGRPNPFASIGYDSSQIIGTTSQNTIRSTTTPSRVQR